MRSTPGSPIVPRLLALLALSAATACSDTTPPATVPVDAGATDVPAGSDASTADVTGDDVAAADVVVEGDAPATDAPATDAPTCLDNDRDGYPATECGGLAADCDDGNDRVNPGRAEVCDRQDLDEDCNPCTVAGAADGDGDGDTYQSATCGNAFRGTAPACPASVRVSAGRVFGTDCNDGEPSIHPNQAEACNDRDDNCNDVVDEDVPRVNWYLDRDGDGHAGTAEAATLTCAPPSSRHVRLNDDCNDTDPLVSPDAPEVCDGAMRDENCSGMPNEGCDCAPIGVSRMCCGTRGTQSCAASPTGATWSACSATSTPEVCDGVDNNCDGRMDEGLRVPCYRDVDGDGFAVSGASVEQLCPPGTTPGVCPAGYTLRAPTSATTSDCDDSIVAGRSRFPTNPEVCNNIDDNCNVLVDEVGTTDRGQRIDCYTDSDNDGWAPSGAARSSQCRTATNGCPTSYTSRAPGATAGTFDCSDLGHPEINPVAREQCSTVDEDCNGDAYNGFTRPGTTRSCTCQLFSLISGSQSANLTCAYDTVCNYTAGASATIYGNALVVHEVGAACNTSEWCVTINTSTTRAYGVQGQTLFSLPRGRYDVVFTTRNMVPVTFPVSLRYQLVDGRGVTLGGADVTRLLGAFNTNVAVTISGIDIAADCTPVEPRITIPATIGVFPANFVLVSTRIIRVG